MQLTAGRNLMAFCAAAPCDLTRASEAIDDLQTQSLDAVAIARWQQGAWSVHIRGFAANDFAVDPMVGYFVRSRNSGTWVSPPVSP